MAAGDPSEPSTPPVDIPADIRTALERVQVLLTLTDDGRDTAYAESRSAAIRLAAAVGADLLLLDRTGETWIGGGGPGRGPFDAAQLRELHETSSPGRGHKHGHQHLLDQLEEADAAGVKARVWLAGEPGFGGLEECLHHCPVDALVLPDHLDRPSGGDRRRERQGLAEELGRIVGDRDVVVAGPAGALSLGWAGR